MAQNVIRLFETLDHIYQVCDIVDSTTGNHRRELRIDYKPFGTIVQSNADEVQCGGHLVVLYYGQDPNNTASITSERIENIR